MNATAQKKIDQINKQLAKMFQYQGRGQLKNELRMINLRAKRDAILAAAEASAV